MFVSEILRMTRLVRVTAQPLEKYVGCENRYWEPPFLLPHGCWYAGVIAGVQYITEGKSSSPTAVADLALSGLEEGLAAARHNFPLLRQRYLGAAAFLARQASDSEEEEEGLGGSVADAVCYRVLQQLCMAPLRR